MAVFGEYMMPDFYSIDAQFQVPHLTVQLCTYRWPRQFEIERNRGAYYVSRQILPTYRETVARCTYRGTTRYVSCGPLSLAPPDMLLGLRCAEGEKRVLHCIFEKDYFEEMTGLADSLNQRKPESFLNIKNDFLRDLMRRLEQELPAPSECASRLIQAVGKLILVELVDYLHGDRGDGRILAGGLAGWQLRRIEEYLLENANQRLPAIARLAELCSVSAGHLMRGFKISTGMTIHKHMEEIRLQKAMLLLAESDKSFKEIAIEVGFSSSSYFSAVFGKLTGKTPTEYRGYLQTTLHRRQPASAEARAV